MNWFDRLSPGALIALFCALALALIVTIVVVANHYEESDCEALCIVRGSEMATVGSFGCVCSDGSTHQGRDVSTTTVVAP